MDLLGTAMMMMMMIFWSALSFQVEARWPRPLLLCPTSNMCCGAVEIFRLQNSQHLAQGLAAEHLQQLMFASISNLQMLVGSCCHQVTQSSRFGDNACGSLHIHVAVQHTVDVGIRAWDLQFWVCGLGFWGCCSIALGFREVSGKEVGACPAP